MNIFSATEENITKAAELLRSSGVVAMPTETVYGLAANVYDSKAVANIFAIKGRPTFNPLISHIAEVDFLKEYAAVDSRVLELAKKYWPGPLTFVLKRTDENPALDLVCAGLKTITVRMPNHPVALDLIKKAGVPLAAPSANASQTMSPTTAEHVYESLQDKVDMILDGGACRVGVESTIIDMTGKEVVMLRAGGVSLEELETFLSEKVLISDGNPDKPTSPGQLLKHYAPHHTFRINADKPEKGEFYIGFGDCQNANLNLSPSGNLCEAASNLFSYLHLADKHPNITGIAMAPIPNKEIGMAINDRIKRAAKK
ncbi:MAG: L-threonylcarbamoyladenylate synthase [Alphaproteobacteria bacterium]|nr:L-threonylcarbamoyladenylate synthase [Alphaproteobacteria bacterium]